MHKLLIVDDDQSMRNLLRVRLSDAYQVFDTEDPEQALALALQHKPDVVLLDLMMPKFSGFELCQSLRSLTYTSRIPVFIVTGKGGAEAREHCERLGATGYFEKPVNFQELKRRLNQEIETQRPERRASVRVRMRIPLKLRGTDDSGKAFEELTITENVSAGGFLCPCKASLVAGSIAEVFLSGVAERFAGRALVVRKDMTVASVARYGFQLQEKTGDWVLQG